MAFALFSYVYMLPGFRINPIFHLSAPYKPVSYSLNRCITVRSRCKAQFPHMRPAVYCRTVRDACATCLKIIVSGLYIYVYIYL